MYCRCPSALVTSPALFTCSRSDRPRRHVLLATPRLDVAGSARAARSSAFRAALPRPDRAPRGVSPAEGAALLAALGEDRRPTGGLCLRAAGRPTADRRQWPETAGDGRRPGGG